MPAEFPRNHFVGRMRNQPRFLRRQLSQILVHQRRGLLQDPKRPDQLRRHGVFANREVHQRPRCLRPVIPVRRHLHLPHAVRFRTRGGGLRGFCGFRHEGTPGLGIMSLAGSGMREPRERTKLNTEGAEFGAQRARRR